MLCIQEFLNLLASQLEYFCLSPSTRHSSLRSYHLLHEDHPLLCMSSVPAFIFFISFVDVICYKLDLKQYTRFPFRKTVVTVWRAAFSRSLLKRQRLFWYPMRMYVVYESPVSASADGRIHAQLTANCFGPDFSCFQYENVIHIIVAPALSELLMRIE